jgi:hypothetical protein
MIDLSEYRGLAGESGAFTDIELDILDEALASCERSPGKPDILVEIRDGRTLAGFAVMRREEAAEYTFNVQALCLGPSYLGTAVTGSLLARLEEEVRGRAESAILRVETSTAKAAAFGSGALSEAGYSLIGHIPDFYSAGNDYYMYAKHLRPRDGEAAGGSAKGRQG